MQRYSTVLKAILRHLCFFVGMSAVFFLWPDVPDKSPGILRQANGFANDCSSRLFVCGFKYCPVAGVPSKIERLKRKDILVVTREQPENVYHSDSLTFRHDNLFLVGLKFFALFGLFLLVYAPGRCTSLLGVFDLAVCGGGFLSLFLLRAVAYGMAMHFFSAASIISGADPVVRRVLLSFDSLCAVAILLRTDGKAAEESHRQARSALLLFLAMCALAGCHGDFSNCNVTLIKVGGTGEDGMVLFLGIGMMLGVLAREIATLGRGRAKDEARIEPAGDGRGRPSGRTRSGFTQKQVAKWFLVTVREVKRWESGEASPPKGYSKELRMSGDWKRMETVLTDYWDLKRSQGADVYSAKMVLHGLSDEESYRKRFR